MAIANAKCTCKKCGNKFEMSAKKHSRKEANSWEIWVADYYDECPECRTKAKVEKLMQGEVIKVHYSVYKNKYADKKIVPNSYNASTKTILVVLKTAEEIKAEQEKANKNAHA